MDEETDQPEGAAPPDKTPDGDWVEDISDTVAPSVGPHSTVTHHAPSGEKPADVDAMGLEKRREVVGGSYGPSFGRQATLYGGFLAIVAVLVIGFVLLAGELDKAPETSEDEAPWSKPEAAQTPPSPLQ